MGDIVLESAGEEREWRKVCPRSLFLSLLSPFLLSSSPFSCFSLLIFFACVVVRGLLLRCDVLDVFSLSRLLLRLHGSRSWSPSFVSCAEHLYAFFSLLLSLPPVLPVLSTFHVGGVSP